MPQTVRHDSTRAAADRSVVTPAGDPGSGRDAFFDNVKFFAVLLVVLGHTLGFIAHDPDNRVARAVYMVVYAFHMPLFIMVCGYFSRSFARQPTGGRRLERLLCGTLIPYLLFTVLYGLYLNLGRDEWIPIRPLVPWYLLWFLVALFIWRITAPLWTALRAPLPIALALMIAIGWYRQPEELALGQVFQFLPFFVIGLVARREHVRLVRESRVLRWAAAPIFAVALAAAYHVAPTAKSEWLYRRSGHDVLGVSMLHWTVVSLGLAAVGLVLSLAFLAVIPSRASVVTGLGENSKYIYLLHGFLIEGARRLEYDRITLWTTPAGLILLSLIAATVAVLLGSRPVRALTRWAVEPRLGWAFVQPADAANSERRTP
jgi:fucose 4-O-acetylase-like acetyltransferase